LFYGKQDKTLGILSHVLAIFTWVIGPLIVYVVADDEFTKDNARNALNWQISLTIYSIVSGILTIVLIGIVMLAVLGLLNIVFCVMAAVKASDGETWEYPITINLM